MLTFGCPNVQTPILFRMQSDTSLISNHAYDLKWQVQTPINDTATFYYKHWDYSADSALYFGSGFWFEDVMHFLREYNSFHMQRHEGVARQNRKTSESLMLGLILFEVLLVGFMLKRGLKLMAQYTNIGLILPVDGSVSDHDSQSRYNPFLWFLTLIVLSLMAHVLVNTKPGNSIYGFDSLMIFKLFAYTCSFFIVQNAIVVFIGKLFFNSSLIRKWVFHNKTTLFIYAMTLTPLLIAAEIAIATNYNFLFYWSVAFLIIAKLWLFAKALRIFSVNSSGLFYFILYLCALEILPILLFYKGLFLL